MLPTHRQREILEAIRSHVARHGRAPTLMEIARRVGLASVSTVHKHLELLEERGLVRRRRKGRRQAIDLLPQARRGSAVAVPLLGRIAAGLPIKAIAEQHKVHTPSFVGFVIKFSVPILLPVLLLVCWLTLRG